VAQPTAGLDAIAMHGTINLGGWLLAIRGGVALPAGALTSTRIAVFPSVSVIPAKSDFIYLYGPWQVSTPYSVGQKIVDPSRNEQEAATYGTSGITAPVWNDSVGGTTNDGSVVWLCEGPYTPTELSIAGTAAGNIYTPRPSLKPVPFCIRMPCR
jgi:hypothetical protein